MTVTAVLRSKQDFSLAAHAASGGGVMSREQFAAQHGADPEDVLKVEEYAGAHHLSIDEVNLPARTVVLRGRTADMQEAFGVTFKLYATEGNRRFRGREGEASVPDELEGIITAVLGLDDRPVAKPHIRRLDPNYVEPQLGIKPKAAAAAPAATPHAFNALDVGKLYGFPSNLNGTGQCIAIIESPCTFPRTPRPAFSTPSIRPCTIPCASHRSSRSVGAVRRTDGRRRRCSSSMRRSRLPARSA